MKNAKPWRQILAAFTLILLAAGGYALAQESTGNLYGKVKDQGGAPLPGVTLTLTGPGAPQVQVSDNDGQFRFPSLSPGKYKLTSQLDGFSPLEYPSVVISLGRNTDVELSMSAGIKDTITVSAESPLLDNRKVALGTSISQTELEKIPTARDPWSLMSQTPGVQVDRINVGGNESGQQSVFVGKGANSKANQWQVDGVDITDMASQGSSPTYYDFDAFQEFQLTTGGSDVSTSASGVTVNVVTKRGTDAWRGSGRFFDTEGKWQSTPSISNSQAGVTARGVVQDLSTFTPNKIGHVKDYGAEAGGAIVKDHLWVWGAYGKDDVLELAGGGTPDATQLKNYNGKLNAQVTGSNSATGQFSDGEKIKSGRGAGPGRAPETTENQGGPTKVYKVDDTQIFNPNFYATGLYSLVRGGFTLTPKGGLNADVFELSDGIYRGSYYYLVNKRNSDQGRLDAANFFNAGSMSHELKYGAGYRTATTSSLFGYSKQRISYDCAIKGCDGGPNNTTHFVNFIRDSNVVVETKYTTGWIQDTATAGNLTANLGLRFERANGANKASAASAVVLGGTTFLPALSYPGAAGGFTFNTILPRLGLTYALGAEHKSLLRLSYARYAEQLGQGFITGANPIGLSQNLGTFQDLNHNGIMDASEVGTFHNLAYANFDPNHPNSLVSPSRIASNLSPAKTDELNAGIDHALLPEFVVGLAATYRRISNIEETQELVNDGATVRVVNASDFVPESKVRDGRTINYFVLRPGISDAGGTLLINGDRKQKYVGGAFTFTKRLANHWMARGNLSFTNWTWQVPKSYFNHQDPTLFGLGQGIYNFGGTPTTAATGDINGDVVAEQSSGSGSKNSVFLNSKYSFNLNGLYQVAQGQPWAFNVSTNVSGRQGFPAPLYYSITGSDGISRQVLVSANCPASAASCAAGKLDSHRFSNIYTVDGRIDKEFTFSDFGLTISADVFNILNNNSVLQRQLNQGVNSGVARSNFVTETISPRIFRLGARFSFK
ncbi:MAG TPA: TonB-dependent receptor [Thermoanaerobaculia bacterium]|nr:TonB-dependent receptor [Thermoanaerobaculia bacterium]